MLLFLSVVLSFFLALRELALAVIRKKISWKEILFFVLYVALGAFLFSFSASALEIKEHLRLLGLFTTLFALEIWLHTKTSKITFFLKLSFFSFFVLVCVGQSIVSSFSHFYEDRPIAKITLTGSVQSETVAWKNPSSSLQEVSFPSYEVKLETLEGKILAQCFVYGDLVGIRAQVLRLHPFLAFLGLPNLYKIDSLFNDYFSQEKKQSLPHLVFPVREKTSLWSFFWHKGIGSLWKSLFFQNKNSLFIKSATLEANYFPLVSEQGNPLRAEYYLTVTAGGLSSLAHAVE